MKFYDFLYYIIYTFYAGKEKGAASTSAGVVGGLQAMNLLTVAFLLSFYILKFTINKWYVLGMAIIFQITTYIRYIYREDNSIEEIEKKWFALSEPQRSTISVLSVVYIISTLILFFGVAIFIGSKR